MRLHSRVTSLQQQAMISFGGQEYMGSGGEAATCQVMWQGRRRLTCAAKVDGEVVSVVALEPASFCSFSILHGRVCAWLWKPVSPLIQNPARRFSYSSPPFTRKEGLLQKPGPVPGDRQQGVSDSKGRCHRGFAPRDPAAGKAEVESGWGRALPCSPPYWAAALPGRSVLCGAGRTGQRCGSRVSPRGCDGPAPTAGPEAGPSRNNTFKNNSQNRLKKKRKKARCCGQMGSAAKGRLCRGGERHRPRAPAEHPESGGGAARAAGSRFPPAAAVGAAVPAFPEPTRGRLPAGRIVTAEQNRK